MSADPSTAATLVAAAGVAQVATAPTGEPLSDLALIGVAAGIGLAGGILATIEGDEPVTRRKLASRMLASGLLAPSLVVGAFMYMEISPTVLQALAFCGPAGLLAWPVWQRVPAILDWMMRKKAGKDG